MISGQICFTDSPFCEISGVLNQRAKNNVQMGGDYM
jgi:hypothetical protein